MRDFILTILGPMHGNAFIGRRNPTSGLLNIWETFAYPAELDKMVTYAEAYDQEDVYLSPLIYGDKTTRLKSGRVVVSRTPENALNSNTIYQDSDTCPKDEFRLPPSVHVTSSTGRFQDYWILDKPITAHQAADMSHRICTAHEADGSDPSSWSANKVLRIPHSHNTTHGFPEEVLVEYTGAIYEMEDLLREYEEVEYVQRTIMRVDETINIESDLDLPDYTASLDKLSHLFNMELITKPHPEGSDRSKMRYKMLCELWRDGSLTLEEVLSIAWHAPVSSKWRADARNIHGLIAEALKAKAEVDYENGEGIEAPEASAMPTTDSGFVRLLSEDERESIRNVRTWPKDYVAWVNSKMSVVNEPYDRMNAWSILSAAFSDTVFIPRENGPEYCNFFTCTVGETTSGKSQSLKLWRTVMNEIFGEDNGWNIGGNASPNGLYESLLNRDKKVSVFNTDEGHGFIKQITEQQWSSGMIELFAKFYDGFVDPVQRTSNKQISGKSATTYFIMHLMGIPEEMFDVMTRNMIKNGFIPRMVWAIGNPRTVTKESMKETQSNGEYIRKGYEPMARQWAAEFKATKKARRAAAKAPMMAMEMTDEALERMSDVKWDMRKLFDRHQNFDVLEPGIVRLGGIIRRAATLLAAEDGSDVVTLEHTLCAIEAAEEWLTNMVIMCENISESEWKRQVDEVVNFIHEKGGEARLEVVNRKFASRRTRDLAEHIDAAISQGLIRSDMRGKQGKWLVANE